MKNNRHLKKTYYVLVLCLFINLMSIGSVEAVTIATFSDPATDWSTPLLEVDLFNNEITSRWDDSKTGLSLDIFDTTYNNAFFIITDSSDNIGVTYIGDVSGGATGAGKIKFFENGQDTGSTPLVLIEFDEAHLSFTNFAASDFLLGDDVIITANSQTYINETFSFALGNQVPIDSNWDKGYTATAAFSSSGTIPEPATIALLGVGWLITSLARKRKTV